MDVQKTLNLIVKIFSNGYAAYAILAAAAIWVMNLYNKNKELEIRYLQERQNNIALTDTVTLEKQKNGDLQASQTALLLSERDLKKVNRELYNEIRAQKGEVLALTKSITILKQDSTILRKYVSDLESSIQEIQEINDSTYSAPWILTYNYDENNYDIFKGKTMIGVSKDLDKFNLSHLGTEILERETKISLTWGSRIEDDKLRVYIQSSYPGFTVEQLNGVVLDPNDNKYIKQMIRDKKWFRGFGFGVAATTGYDVMNGNWGIIIGPSVHYNIYSVVKNK